MAYYSVATFSGPALGPIIASFASVHLGWKWAFIIPSILSSATLVALVIGCPETYSPVLLSKVAKRLREEEGLDTVFSALELAEMESRELPKGHRLRAEAWRLLGTPLIMIVAEPIVTLVRYLFPSCC
jgi:DHA1 family multidrug resistance protein-like MFS transporter